jgi:aryl-alcohol dehydrogenase-like predicted oxidoreductase
MRTAPFSRRSSCERGRRDVFGLCLGGNVFGWTADERGSFAVLDAYAEAGGNFLDTANSYLVKGGESETIIGDWMADRGNRDQIVLATKVGSSKENIAGEEGLSPDHVAKAVRSSLRRLKTDRIDLLYAHKPDRETPLEHTLRAFDELVRDGLVRHIGFSNHTAGQLEEAIAITEREGLAPIRVLQDHYNLLERDYEDELAPLVARHELVEAPYFGLAKGFLTGKYRPGGDAVDSRRAQSASAYLDDPRGIAVLEALDEIAHDHGVSLAAVALAWLRTRPGIVAPIASARTPEQLAEILPSAELSLSGEEADRLTAAGQAAA